MPFDGNKKIFLYKFSCKIHQIWKHNKIIQQNVFEKKQQQVVKDVSTIMNWSHSFDQSLYWPCTPAAGPDGRCLPERTPTSSR